VVVHIVRIDDTSSFNVSLPAQRRVEHRRPAMANALATVTVNGTAHGKLNGKAIKSKNQLRRAKAKAKKASKTEVRSQGLFIEVSHH